MLIALSANAQVNLTFTPSKATWATLGDAYGEVVGQVSLTGTDKFDHIEAEMRCTEDPEQYITFINMYSPKGDLRCATGDNWKHQLYNGYHYTLIIRAFDVPYYDSEPIKTTSYNIVGQGITAPVYTDINLTGVGLQPNPLYLNGYNVNGPSFDVTFSAPLSSVKAWWAMGMDGSMNLEVVKKNSNGTVWTVLLPSDAQFAEGSINVQITGWDLNGIQIRGTESGEHSFALNIVTGTTTGISNAALVPANDIENKAYNLAGQKVSPSTKGIVILNGKKVLNR